MEGFMNCKQQQQNNHPAMPMNPQDPEEFRRQGYMIIDFIADYYKNVENYPVRSQVEPNYLRKRLPTSAPDHPESIETILSDVQSHIMPGITHWQSPNHFAYFPSSASIAGVLGETLAAGFDVVGFNWISSPAATELETIVIDWLGEMISLPKSFMFSGGGGGTLLGTTCEALLCCVVAARDKALERIGKENVNKLVVYASDQTHCSFQKSAKIAGILPENFRIIPTTRSNAFAMRPEDFKSTIQSDLKSGLVPLFLCATVGTTSTTAVDPLHPLCAIAKDYGIWVHVDAAYAGNACICPEYRSYINGVEGATSFSFNAHKWFLTTLDCCCLWVKDPNALIRALSTDPEYLKNKATDSQQVVDYKDWGITLSRRFRALKLWMVLRSYGVNNLQAFIRSHVDMAKHFESLLAQDDTFEVVVPRYFANVCFRVSPKAILKHLHQSCSQKKINYYLEEEMVNDINKELLESINSDGKVYMSHSVVDGVYVIRFAVGASLTEYKHVDFAWKVIQEHAHAMLTRRLQKRCRTACSDSNNNTNLNRHVVDAAAVVSNGVGSCEWEAPAAAATAAAVGMGSLPMQVALNIIGPC